MLYHKAPLDVVPSLLVRSGGPHCSEGWTDLVPTGQTGFASLSQTDGDFPGGGKLNVYCCDLEQISTT